MHAGMCVRSLRSYMLPCGSMCGHSSSLTLPAFPIAQRLHRMHRTWSWTEPVRTSEGRGRWGYLCLSTPPRGGARFERGTVLSRCSSALKGMWIYGTVASSPSVEGRHRPAPRAARLCPVGTARCTDPDDEVRRRSDRRSRASESCFSRLRL